MTDSKNSKSILAIMRLKYINSNKLFGLSESYLA